MFPGKSEVVKVGELQDFEDQPLLRLYFCSNIEKIDKINAYATARILAKWMKPLCVRILLPKYWQKVDS